MRQMSLGIKSFCGKPSLNVNKKMDERKQIRWAVQKRSTKHYGQCRPSKNEKAIKFEMRIFNGTYPLSINIEILRIHEDHVTTTDVTKFSKPIEEMSKEELSVFL